MTIKKNIVQTELLFDTNFYISLIDLNTEEAHINCNQLFEIAQRLGFKFTILERTIEQIKILLSNRISQFSQKNILGSIRYADIFNACIRRNLQKTDLERYKDSIITDLNKRGITVIYDSMIRSIIDKAKKYRFKRTYET